jgi:hypothetical protein
MVRQKRDQGGESDYTILRLVLTVIVALSSLYAGLKLATPFSKIGSHGSPSASCPEGSMPTGGDTESADS